MERQSQLERDIGLLAPKQDFIELAHLLTKLRKRGTDEFEAVVGRQKLGIRKARYLLAISKYLKANSAQGRRLREVGWTKTMIIGAYAKRQDGDINLDELISLAENCTSRALAMQLSKTRQRPQQRAVYLFFSSSGYERLKRAMLKNGARKSSRGDGIERKEKAILSILRQSGYR